MNIIHRFYSIVSGFQLFSMGIEYGKVTTTTTVLEYMYSALTVYGNKTFMSRKAYKAFSSDHMTISIKYLHSLGLNKPLRVVDIGSLFFMIFLHAVGEADPDLSYEKVFKSVR
jgi:hypothetical protein